MSFSPLKKLKRLTGIDTQREKYAYAQDPVYGHISESRVADRWIKTTCGYCSVGCGMLLGVRDNKAVAVRGNPDHPVNQGKLCPKVSPSITPSLLPDGHVIHYCAKTVSLSPSRGTKRSTP